MGASRLSSASDVAACLGAGAACLDTGAAGCCDGSGSAATGPEGGARPNQASRSRACVPITSVFMLERLPTSEIQPSVPLAYESPARDRLGVVVRTLRRPLRQAHL